MDLLNLPADLIGDRLGEPRFSSSAGVRASVSKSEVGAASEPGAGESHLAPESRSFYIR